MRTIKFRAWNPNSKRMYIIDVLALGEVTWSCSSENGMSMAYQPHIEVMQFTGILDKHGNEIYEGDIVISGETKYTVISLHGCFFGKSPNGLKYLLYQMDISKKVVGNIYENPELLK